MKLIYLANARIPTLRAYGLQIMKTCEAFVAAGLDVELVTPTRNFVSPEDPFAYYGVTHPFKLTKLAVPDFLRFGRIGFFLSALWFSEKARFLASFWSVDIVYSRDALVLVQYLLLGRTLIFEAHSKPTWLSLLVARFANKLVVISHGLRDAYATAGIAPEKIVVAPDAVDERLFEGAPEKVEARRALGFEASSLILLYAGHLYSRKGADTLAEAAKHVPEALVVFVGGSSDDIEAFRGRWGRVPNIKIVGHVPHREIPAYLRAADIVVLPNSGKDEDSARFTSPMKLFEYMASGTPIMASDLPSLREILSDESAYFFRADDADSLAECARTMLSNPQEAGRKATEAHTRIKNYSWTKRAETILAGSGR